MNAYRYFQLMPLDGKGPPRFYYRQSELQDDVWSSSQNQWVPTTSLLRMLTSGEPTLDMIDHDPTVGLKGSDE